jgi:hypothetical protein
LLGQSSAEGIDRPAGRAVRHDRRRRRAGLEQVNRDVLQRVTHLLLVSDTSAKGLKVAALIRETAVAMGVDARSGLLLNRARNEQEAVDTSCRYGEPCRKTKPSAATRRGARLLHLSAGELTRRLDQALTSIFST